MPPTPISISDAYQAVEAFAKRKPLVRIPSLFFTPAHRRAAYTVYAFCRTADNLVDENQTTPDQFAAWRKQLHLPIEQQTDPLLVAWSDLSRTYQLDPALQEAFLDGLALDLNCHRYETLEELKKYAYGVATAPFLIAMQIVGFRPGVSLQQAQPYIENMGIALQFTNIIRDIKEDLEIGRIYLPKQELAAFGLTFADIEQKRNDERFKNFLRHFIKITQQHYAAAWPLLNMWQGSFRLAAGFGFILYRSFLYEIEAHQFDVFTTHRTKIPVWKMFWLLANKWPAIYWPNQANKYFS